MKRYFTIVLSSILILLFGSIILLANSNTRDIEIDGIIYTPMPLNQIKGTNTLYLAWQIEEMLKNIKPSGIEYKYPCFVIPLGHSIEINDNTIEAKFWTDFEIKATTNNFTNVTERIDDLQFTDGICYLMTSKKIPGDIRFAYENCGFDEGARIYYKSRRDSDAAFRRVKKFDYMTKPSIYSEVESLDYKYVVDARVIPGLDSIVVSNGNRRITIAEDVVRKYLYRENPRLRWIYTRFDSTGNHERDEKGNIVWHDIEPEWFTVRKEFTEE